MEQFTPRDVALLVRSLMKELRDAGMEDVRVLSAGEEALELYRTASRGRRFPQLAFREEAVDTCPGIRKATWMFGMDRYGIAVMLAFNRIDLGEETLAQHLEQHGALYLVEDIPVLHPNPRVYAGPAHRLTGTACYLGEAWFREDRPEAKGFRGLGLSRQVIRLGMAMAYLNFRPTFMFGLAPPKIAESGIALRYGHYQVYPLGAVWPRADGELDEVFLCVTDENDYTDLFGEAMRRRILLDDFRSYQQESLVSVA